jgi:hypothetical protein
VPVCKLYHNGLSAGIPPGKSRHQRALRGEIRGWSTQAARNNTAFLRSVDIPRLTGVGLTFTLTVKHTPQNSDEWHRLRVAFIMRLKRMGVCRGHWVTEWQRRGAPHLHGIVYFPQLPYDKYISIVTTIKNHWLELTQNYGSLPVSQNIKPVNDALGWVQYLAKHASRGVNHYQRSSKNIPPGWRKTGRVWGQFGDWPADEPIRLTIDSQGFNKLRRLIKKWRCADANKSGDLKRIIAARRMLQAGTREKASVRGVSEWVPSSTYFQMIAFIASEGHYVAS